MTNDTKAEITRKSLEVLQKIKADSRLSHYVPTDRIPSVFMETDAMVDRYIRSVSFEDSLKFYNAPLS